MRNSSEPVQTLIAATRLSVKGVSGSQGGNGIEGGGAGGGGGRFYLQKSKLKSKFTLVHLSAVIFASIIILISAMLGK